MFTRGELFFVWIPGMIIGALLFAVMVGTGNISIYGAAVCEVLLGILLKFAARRINPPTPQKSEEASGD